ncbi:hypothetical protein D3C87_1733030 [compost metagenome]
MITSIWFPAFSTSVATSSRCQGEFRQLIRTHRPTPRALKSVSRAIATAPARATPLASAGMASSRLARITSTLKAISGTLARTLSRCGGTKWIIRSTRAGGSRQGVGAPIARGLKNPRGVFMARASLVLFLFRSCEMMGAARARGQD